MTESDYEYLDRLYEQIDELQSQVASLNKALDKACEELVDWVVSCGANNTGDMDWVYPFNTKEQWKEWCLHEDD